MRVSIVVGWVCMKSRIERVTQLAMQLGQQHLAPYGSVKSRHDFTQRQLMSCLILKAYLKTSCRGLIDTLQGHSVLRRVLGMEEKLPHYTALQKFSARKDVLAVASAMMARIGRAALCRQGGKKAAVALDSAGLEPTSASAHYLAPQRTEAEPVSESLPEHRVRQPAAPGAGARLGAEQRQVPGL